MSAASGILWSWQGIADYIQLSPDTARKLADQEGLPVSRGGDKMVQSTKEALDAWATERAMGGVAGVSTFDEPVVNAADVEISQK